MCVTVFPAKAFLRCRNTVSSPVTTDFALAHLIACVHFGADFQSNWSGSHPCRGYRGKKVKKNPQTIRIHRGISKWLRFLLARQLVFFPWHSVWPEACRSNLFEGSWIRGRMRLRRGSLFWLRHTPLPFTTIQVLSYSKPSGPTGQSWTCMQNSSGSKQDMERLRERSKRQRCWGSLHTSCAPHDLMGYM